MTVIEVRGLCKTYHDGDRELPILVDADLHVEEGEFVSICGPSGCGKSTLLQCIAGLESYQSGEVRILGKNLTTMREPVRAGFRNTEIGFVFQQFHLLPGLSALENVMVPLLIARRPMMEARAEAARILDTVGLGDRLSHRPHQLSGGEQQRVAVARALVHDPGLIVADEPTGNLDPETGWEVFRLLMQAHERGATVLVATHNQAVLTALNKRTIRLRAGLIERDGLPELSSLDETLPPAAKPMIERFQDLGGQAGSAPV